MGDNYSGKIVYFKSGNHCFEKHPLLEIETPVKFLVIEEADDNLTVLPMFYGDIKNEKDCYNELTLRTPFMESNVPDYIKALSVQINAPLQIEKWLLSEFDECNYDTDEIYLLYSTYATEKESVPKLVKNIQNSIVSVIEHNYIIKEIITRITEPEQVSFIETFINNTMVAYKDTLFWHKPAPGAASCCATLAGSLDIEINDLKAKGKIMIVENEYLEQTLTVEIFDIHVKGPIAVLIKFVVDGIETKEFEVGYTEGPNIMKELGIQDIPWLKKDSVISKFVIGIK